MGIDIRGDSYSSTEIEMKGRDTFRRWFEQLQLACGPQATELLSSLASGHIDIDTFEAEVESAPDFGAFQKESMKLLELYGVLEETTLGTIVDVEALKQLSPGLFYAKKQKGGGISAIKSQKAIDFFASPEDLADARKMLRNIVQTYGAYVGENASDFLYNTFRDTEVITKDEYQAAIDADPNRPITLPVAKPLFFNPEQHPDNAFDVETVRAARFHITPWELSKGAIAKNEAYSSFHPDISLHEMMLAVQIYHPAYGNGARNEKGRLHVRDAESGTMVPITQDWIISQKLPGSRQGILKELAYGSPRKALEDPTFSDLVQHRLLQGTDFAKMSGSEHADSSFERAITQKNGMIVLHDGIRYSLGAAYATGEYSVVSITSELYGIVKKDSNGNVVELSAVVDRQYKDEKKETVGVKELQEKQALRVYDPDQPESLVPRREDETDEMYDERTKEIFDFATFMALRKELKTKTAVDISELTIEQQQSVLHIYTGRLSAEQQVLFFDFIKTYGMDGLSALSTTDLDPDILDSLLRIMDAGKTRADVIGVFRKYNDIIAASERVEDELAEFFVDVDNETPVQDSLVTKEMVKRASRFLSEYAESEAHGKTNVEIQEQLDRVRNDLMTFASIFKIACKGKNIDLSSVKGLDIQKLSAGEIEADIRKDMALIAHENYVDESHVANEVARQLQDEHNITKYIVFTKQGSDSASTVLGYLRFIERPNGHVYVGSLNVDKITHGAGLGEQLINATLEDLHGSYDLDAVVVPEIAAGTHYIEKADFVGTGFNPSADETETKNGWFEITLPKEPISSTLRESTTAELVALYEQLYQGESAMSLAQQGREQILTIFDVSTEMDQLTEVSTSLLNEYGYVMTRYACVNNDCTKRLLGFETSMLGDQDDSKQIET